MAEQETEFLWNRALENFISAETKESGAEKANLAYHASYYAVVAFFKHEGLSFISHEGVEEALHKKLIDTDRWPLDLGEAYKRLHKMRIVCDMGCYRIVPEDKVLKAIQYSRRILQVVSEAYPDIFSLDYLKEKN